jgi:predicted phosphodiesterase
MDSQLGAHVQQRRFGIPPTTVADQIAGDVGFTSNQSFEPLPVPTGAFPYRLALDSVISRLPTDVLAFHCVGDTGGIKNPHPQLNVADAMVADIANSPAPSFFYHLGDVVYFNGDESEYGAQFYEPYAHYNLPIFAIPGNHDGDNSDDPSVPSLTAFVQNFCSATPHLDPQAQEFNRDTMDQPNVYWTLDASPFFTIIGLYTNVPSGGQVAQDQADWLAGELRAADQTLPVIVALHHPPYSADAHHGSSLPMRNLLDAAFQSSGRVADVVFTGHVHDYQRFTRTHDGRQVPYVVAGAGGYHNLHPMASDARQGMQVTDDCVLEQFSGSNQWGFLRISVTAATGVIEGKYIAVDGSGATSSLDQFTLDTRAHTVTASGA